MQGRESTTPQLRRGYCLITVSCTRSFTARLIASFTQLSNKRFSPGVPSSMLQSTRKQNRSKEKTSKRCPRPKQRVPTRMDPGWMGDPLPELCSAGSSRPWALETATVEATQPATTQL